jgi:hypothetical protein
LFQAKKREQRSQNSPLGLLLLCLVSGLLDRIAMKYFIEIIRTKNPTPTKEIILLPDNLGIHWKPPSILEALQNG